MDIGNETDIERLREVASLQESEINRLTETMKKMARELALLKGVPINAELSFLLKELNKPKPNSENAPRSKNKKTRRPRSRSGPTPQPNLERQERLFELDVADQVCPCCGERLEPMAGQTEDSR